MVELMKRGTSRRNNGIELVVLDEVAFFATQHKTITLTDALSVVYNGAEAIQLRVNGKSYRFEGGVCRIRATDLLGGSNTCAVSWGSNTLPCEALIRQGNYVMPAGISQKRYVLDLYRKYKKLAALNEELEEKLREYEREDEETDLFNI